MLGQQQRRQHPRDLRQGAQGAVELEAAGEARHQRLRRERRVGEDVVEVGQHVVAIVAINRRVHLPADAARLELLGHGGAGELAEALDPGRAGAEDGAAVRPRRVDRGRHGVEAVGVGGADHRAVVAVAHGEGIGERIQELEIRAGVVAHGERAVEGALDGDVAAHEAVHPATVPVPVLRSPAVVDVVRALAAPGAVEVERIEVVPVETGRVSRLREHREPAAVVEHRHRRVGEAPHPSVAAEVVVEGAVLLDEDDDVLDVAEPAAGRRRGERGADQGMVQDRAGAQRGAARDPRGEHLTPGEPVGHRILSSSQLRSSPPPVCRLGYRCIDQRSVIHCSMSRLPMAGRIPP